MLNFSNAQQILPTVWHLPDFFDDVESVRQSYRSPHSPNQSWTTQYPNRLLTPWSSNFTLEIALRQAPERIQQLTGHAVQPQVVYSSIDLSSSKIMMHRLHPEIGCFIQVFMGEDSSTELNTVFCNNPKVNVDHANDYADVSEFDTVDLTKLAYQPNHAWLMINQPRTFFGTESPVAPNSTRETVNLHFANILPTST